MQHRQSIDRKFWNGYRFEWHRFIRYNDWVVKKSRFSVYEYIEHGMDDIGYR